MASIISNLHCLTHLQTCMCVSVHTRKHTSPTDVPQAAGEGISVLSLYPSGVLFFFLSLLSLLLPLLSSLFLAAGSTLRKIRLAHRLHGSLCEPVTSQLRVFFFDMRETLLILLIELMVRLHQRHGSEKDVP